MALRHNHYEAAFESYLRSHRVPHVVVDEARRALFQSVSLKSLDFIVYSEQTPNLLVDIKGRRFPSSGNGRRWENWATLDDMQSMLAWQDLFGEEFRSLLVFAYDVANENESAISDSTRFHFRDRDYAFFGVWADEYHMEMTTRSTSWQTVNLSSREYRRLRAPLELYL